VDYRYSVQITVHWELSLVLYDDLEGWDGAVGGRLKREEIYTHTHTHIADSLCCTAETNTTL